MPSDIISAPDLFSLVNAEFSRLRPATCGRCVTPTPVRKFPPVGSNWGLSASRPCDKGCREVLRDIEVRLAPNYTLEDPWERGGTLDALHARPGGPAKAAK